MAEDKKSIDLTVTGSITPSACTPSLSQSGPVNLGKLTAEDLAVTGDEPMLSGNLELTVTCAEPMFYDVRSASNSLKTTDRRMSVTVPAERIETQVNKK